MVFIYIDTLLNLRPIECTTVVRSGKFGPLNLWLYTIWMTVVAQTDRLKSVRICCVIKVFVASYFHYALSVVNTVVN